MILSGVLAFWLFLATEHNPVDICKCPCHEYAPVSSWLFHDNHCCHECGLCGLRVRVPQPKPVRPWTLKDKQSVAMKG
jgi:hypothetical protein